MTHVTFDDVELVATSIANRSEGESHSLNNASGQCLYTYPDGSHCLVGGIGEGLALPLPDPNSNTNAAGVDSLLTWWEDQGITVDPQAGEFLSIAQGYADTGYYWPQAVSLALQEV
jgi:hypothetical protein